jgi:poly-gamma-glutamate synthesis protein (capsule biosynthesis protein)
MKITMAVSIMLLTTACEQKKPIPLVQRIQVQAAAQSDRIVIAAVGDIMMPLSVQQGALSSGGGYAALFESISTDFAGADIVIGNLETTVDSERQRSGYPRFNAHPELLVALKGTGFTFLSLANNHIMDAGPDGLIRTIDAVEAAGMHFVGAGRTSEETGRIPVLRIQNRKIAFLAYTYDTNERLPRKGNLRPGVNVMRNGSEQELNAACARVREARGLADVVVLSLHWGEEYDTRPTPWQQRAARALVEAGADLIIGHHPHVLQPVETVFAGDGRRALVAHSLGNFLSSQSWMVQAVSKDHPNALRGDGVILFVSIPANRGRAGIEKAEFLPVWTVREPRNAAVLYKPVNLSRTIEQLGMKKKRTREDERLLELLTHRQARIHERFPDRGP